MTTQIENITAMLDEMENRKDVIKDPIFGYEGQLIKRGNIDCLADADGHIATCEDEWHCAALLARLDDRVTLLSFARDAVELVEAVKAKKAVALKIISQGPLNDAAVRKADDKLCSLALAEARALATVLAHGDMKDEMPSNT